MFQNIGYDSFGNINSRGVNAVPKFHSVVNFIDQQALCRFKEIDGKYAATHCMRCSNRKRCDLVSYWTTGCDGASGCIGNPMRLTAVDRCNTFVTDHETADIPALFLDVFLDVENRVMIAAKNCFVFEDRFGGLAIIDFG